MTRKVWSIILSAFLLFVLCQFAAAGEWAGVRAGNILIAGEAPESDLRVISQRLERFRSAIATLSPRLRGDLSHPLKVIVFPDAAAFAKFGPRRGNGAFDDLMAGYFVSGEDANYIAAISKGRDSANLYHTIFHEYVHNVLRSRGGGAAVPAWLNEGMAQYLETADFTADRKLVVGVPPRGRLEVLAKSELIPLGSLLAARNDEVHAEGTPRRVFYAQAWLLTHLLLSNAPGTDFKERLDHVFNLAGDRSAVERAVTGGLAAPGFEAAMRAYANTRPATQTLAMAAEGHSASEPVAVPIGKAAADALLGGLLVRLGRTDDAEALIKKALAADGSLSQASSSLGEILIARGKYAEARAHLETAERAGGLAPAGLFSLAFAIVKENAAADNEAEKIAPEIAERARRYLRQTINTRPAFVDAYRLLGHIALINNDELREAAASLTTAAALRPADLELQIMLARCYLRLGQYVDAAAIAETIAAGPAGPTVKQQAADVRNTAEEYRRTSREVKAASVGAAQKNILFLKRSWLTDDDLREIERNRELSNLNIVLDRPRPGEVQVLGAINKITCADGLITYHVASDAGDLKLSGSRFEDLKLSVLVHGMHSFKFDCGANFAGQRAVILYKPAGSGPASGETPELTSVTFVPENFRLVNRGELAGARMVVVEDDLLTTGRERDSLSGFSRVSAAERAASIKTSMRRPAPLERQVVGRLGRVDCTGGSSRITAASVGREWEFTAASISSVEVKWFSSKALNFHFSCGSDAEGEEALLTYKPDSLGGLPELTAVEFIPADLLPAALPAGVAR